MNVTVKTAAIAGGMLIALFAAGCGAPGAGVRQVTMQGCAEYGVHAIEHHVTVTWMPAACQGLSRTGINQAVARAIFQVAGGRTKPVWRKRAAEVAPWLTHLITSPPQSTAGSVPGPPRWSASGEQFSALRPARDVAMGIAALVAWLVTAGSGAYVLAAWISHGGNRRQRTGSADGTGAPAPFILGHFGLAAGGLAVWVSYLIAGWAALAWIAVGLLLPVAGLGVAMVALGLPGHQARTAAAGSDDLAASPGVGTGREPARSHPPVLVVASHGLLAATTVLLVSLAALGSG